MRKVNTKDITEETWSSPKGKFSSGYRGISRALGRKEKGIHRLEGTAIIHSTWRFAAFRRESQLPLRHSHSAQWEL